MSERQEKKNQRISLLTSVGIHFTMLILFLFAMGWTAPNPPLSEYGSGVELNLGLDSEGSGDVQPETLVNKDATPTEEVAKSDQAAQPAEEQKEEEAPKPKETAKEETPLTSPEDSPVEVKETKKDVKKDEPPKEKVKESKEKPVRKDSQKEKKEVEKVVRDAYVKKASDDGTKKASGAQSQGDDKNKAGDKGSPEGSLDPNGQYTGKPGIGGSGAGGGNGFALQMSGWNWDEQPQAPKLPDNENGKIVFEIEVDADGEITGIKTLERGLSPEAEKLCKQEIQKRSLIRTAGSAAPARSKGRITFVLRNL